MQGHAVDNGPHGVLADAKVDGVATGLRKAEIVVADEERLGSGGQVGGEVDPKIRTGG